MCPFSCMLLPLSDRDKLVCGNNLSERGHLLPGEGQTTRYTKRVQGKGNSLTGERRRMDKSGRRKNLTERRALTIWTLQTDGRVRTWKASDQVRATHVLKNADGGGASQDTMRTQASKVYSPGEGGTWCEGRTNLKVASCKVEH